MNGMLKAGLIGLAVGGLFGLGVTLLLPLCTPCLAILVGLGVGFLACLWDKPASSGGGAALGAKSGAIAGVGHLGGQLIGMLMTRLRTDWAQVIETMEQLSEIWGQQGVDVSAVNESTYWTIQAAFNTGCGLTSVAVAAGLGALGGLLWYQTMGKNKPL